MYKYRQLVTILLVLSPLAYLPLDIYTPSLPAISEYMGASIATTQLSITVYILGLGLSQLFWGPLSDSYGRRSILLIGLSISLLATIATIFAETATFLVLMRLLAGLGVGSATIVCASILSDSFDRSKVGVVASYLSIAFSVVPILAPVIGGILQDIWFWQANFVFITIVFIMVFFVLYIYLPETLPVNKRQSFKPKQVANNYIKILTHKSFFSFALIMPMMWAISLSYAIMTPFIFQKDFNVSPLHYGILALLTAIFYMLGTTNNSQLIKKYDPAMITRLGVLLTMLFSSVLFVMIILNYTTLFVVVGFSCLVIFSTGLVFSNCLGMVLKLFPEMGGTASAVVNTILLLGGTLFTFLISVLTVSITPLFLAIWYLAFSLLGVFIVFSIKNWGYAVVDSELTPVMKKI